MRNNRLSFFKHFTKSETDIILKNCVEMDFEANDIIFKKGSKKFSGAIIINEGTIDCFDDKSDLPINGFSKGEYFNFSSNLFSNERAFTAVNALSFENKSVSYTHLTLPTICSV